MTESPYLKVCPEKCEKRTDINNYKYSDINTD